MSSSTLEVNPVVVLWGCELNAGSRRCVVKEEDDLLEHIVTLKTVSLGSDAKDELHVVAVESRNMSNVHKPVSIATLERSVLPMVTLDCFEFIPPVAFTLKSGTGPVYLHGQHLILDDDSEYETTEEDVPDDLSESEDSNDAEEDTGDAPEEEASKQR